MMNKQFLNNQKGIGIIEVMIAAVIFALGSIAIIQLQGNFFKSTGAAHSHAVAMNLAEEKLEDLRALEDFTVIDDNTGGNIACTNLLLPSGASAACATSANVIAEANTEYELSWEVTDYYYNVGALSTVPAGNIAQKDINILVTWTDADGSAQTATANTIINSASVGSGGVLVSNAGGSGEQPEVPYTPSIDDRVTPITVGTQSKRETLVPTSDVVDGYSRTEFQAFTYNSNNILLREEEFQNVACDCRFDGTSGTGTETYAAAHAEWNTVKDTYVDVDGELVAGKVKGCVQGGGSNCDANPEPLCDVCCKDHHDISSVTRKYDPYRSSDDFHTATSGNHKHYNGTTVVTSGQYQESCRMKRVDGFWRVYQDWNMVNFKALPITDLSSSTIKATYATYVNVIVDAHIDESKVAGENLTTPPTLPATLNHNTSGNYINLAATGVSEVSGRGVYIDFIDSTHLTAIQTKKAAMEDYLLHLPFYEVEVVEVANWASGDASILEVGPIDNPGNNNDVPAGEIRGVAADTDAVILTADIRKSNSGLTDLSVSVDYDATTNADDIELSDTLTVCVGGSCTGATSSCTDPTGGPDIVDGGAITAWQAPSVISPASCVSETRTCAAGVLSGSYTNGSCSVITAQDCTAPWGATVSDGSSVTAYLDATPTTACTSETRTCTTGVLSGTYTNETCTVTPTTCNTTVTGKANNKNDTVTVNDGTTDFACSVANSKNYTCPVVTTATNGTITATSAGTVNSTVTLGTICGAQTVNF